MDFYLSEKIKNFKKFKDENNNYTEMKDNSKEIKESPKVNKDNENLCFNFNDKICCNVIYINFTNYIINEETKKDLKLNQDISYIKRLFNGNFDKFYATIKLDEQNKIIKEKKLLYLISSKDNTNTNTNTNHFSFNQNQNQNQEKQNYNDIKPEDLALFEEIKNIDYKKKINELNSIKKIDVFKDDFKREKDQSENIRYNKSIFNEEIEPVNNKKIEKKSKLINEEKLNNNYGTNDNLQKKAILVIIIIILFILILIKIF